MAKDKSNRYNNYIKSEYIIISSHRNREEEYIGVKPEWRIEVNSCNETLLF